MKKTYLLLDYETRSRVDLPSCGQHIYAKHWSTEIMCAGWKIIGEDKTHMLTYPGIYTNDPSQTKEFYHALKHCDYVVAHNAAFEQAIYKHVHLLTTPMGAHMRELAPKDFLCTLSFSSILALPRSLEGVSKALNLGTKKDTEGRKLLLKMCKPKKAIDNIQKWIEWVEDDENLKRLYQYCETDLWGEEEIFLRLIKYKPFTEKERRLWELDQKINQRGFKIDLPFVERAISHVTEYEKKLTKDLKLKTFGLVGSAKQVKNFRAFLSDQGFDIPNLQKKTVDDTLAEIEKGGRVADQDVIDVLKIRQALGKSSVSKYQAFKDRCDESDFRVRDNLLFHGASPGRWSGAGVQPQNFPRGTMKIGPSVFVDALTTDLDMLEILYGNPMALYSSALRGVIIPSDGKIFFCGDFSSIEARVLLWVAGDKSGLAEYETGKDTYISMASTVFGKTYEMIKAEYDREGFSEMRQLGKTIILACGYQMGLKKFKDTAALNGLELPDSLITRAHAAFREKYPLVPKVWSNYEQAAIYAVLNKTKKVTTNKVTWYCEGEFLFARLPSGRKIAYYGPEVRNEETPWGELRPKLYVWTTDSKTKQWVHRAVYGGLLTENIVQAISRDCMAESMVRVENAGYDCILTVHDEILTEKENGDLNEFKKLMSTRPDWGLDIPLKVGAWSGERYRK